MRPDFIQANTNGRLHDANEPSLSPLNRGFLYGDAVYEVWRTYEGVLFAWLEHCQRLQESAAALRFVIPWSATQLLQEIRHTATAYRGQTEYVGDLYVRLQISRGSGAIGLDVTLADQPEFTLLVQRLQDVPAWVYSKGYTLSLESTMRRNAVATLNPAWKTGNYLNNILCFRAAKARGADDVLMLNLNGDITEVSTSNIAFIRDGKIVTPPLEAGILGGITRSLIIGEIAALAGLSVEVINLTPDDIPSMDECFIMSTTRDVAPVGAIDEQQFQVGPDTVTTKLKSAFATYVSRQVSSRSEMKLM